MNARKITVSLILISLLLSACSPAVTPERIAERAVIPQVAEVEVQREQELGLAPTAPPLRSNPPVAATQAAYAPQSVPTAVPAPADNFFADYGVNPFVDTYEDHLSTFAIDVDTASYSVARRYINDGNLPPAEAVRVEEFVNYFEAGYPSPADIAFGIYADGAASPFHTDGTHILRFGVQGYRVSEEARQASTLTFVIDVSGSMEMENRLELVKRSLELLVERLRFDDTVAIVVYGSSARIVLYPTSGIDKGTILNAINALSTEGATNAEAGLRMGYSLAMQNYRPGTNNRVVLCSDGVANVGTTGPEGILAEVRGYVEEGVYLTTVGFGMGNFNDVLMEQLADNGNGNYAYIDTLDEAQKLFVEDLTAILQVIALDTKVQVDFNRDVVARYRLIGYENRDVADSDFRNDAVDAGEIGAGHSVTALYAVQFRPGAQGRIATVQLRWQDPQTYQVQEINGNFNTWDLAASFEAAAARYQLAVVVSQYAELLRRSYWASGISYASLNYQASRLSSILWDDAEVVEFAELVSRAGQVGLSQY